MHRYVGAERVARGVGYYRALSNVNFGGVHKKALRQIELDLPRTFPENKHFRDTNGEAVGRLRRVLTAFTRRNPTVGYCQGFNFITAFALLILPEESAFWCLVAIVEHIMPANYFSGCLESARDDQLILKKALECWYPELNEKLQAYEFDISIVTFSWFMTLFVDDIPLQATLRIWDVLLLKGSITLFHFALAYLTVCEDRILSANSRLELFSSMLSLNTQVDDYDELARVAAGTRLCRVHTHWISVILAWEVFFADNDNSNVAVSTSSR